MLKGRNKEQALFMQECSIGFRSIYCIFTGFRGSLNFEQKLQISSSVRQPQL